MHDLSHYALASLGAFLAGAINSVAGGGTLVSFPILVGLGLPSILANTTSTIGIWPGSLGSIWGFRKELGRTDKRMRWLMIPGALGAAIGALLLKLTPSHTFDRVVPFLILFATILFIVQAPIQEKLKRQRDGTPRESKLSVLAIVLMLLVGVYGGYFGAGISIMMLSILGVIGLTDILEMNALTSLFSLCINGVAILFFVGSGLIYWPFVPFMAVGAMVGGYGAAGVARKIGRKNVRRFVICVGLTIAVYLFVRLFL